LYCIKCGEMVIENATYCSSCGEMVKKEIPTESVNTSPINQESSVTEESMIIEDSEGKLTEAYVGSNYSFYKSKWDAMEQKGTSISWNFAAFFLGVFWLGYRKMYKTLLVIFFIFLAVDFLAINVFNYQYSTDQFYDPLDLDSIIGYVTSIFLAMYGNKMYQKHVERKVSDIKINTAKKEQAEMLVKQKGGRSWLGVLLAITLFVFYVSISTFLIPSNVDNIAYVKDGSFYDYPRETVGEAFDDFFENGKWEYVSQNTPYDVVLFTGTLLVDGSRYSVEVEFILDYPEDSFEIRQVKIDNETFTSDEDINDFLHAVYNY
jgi:hypothetical protein